MTTATTTELQRDGHTAPRGNAWHPTFRGIGLAAKIELIRRRPSRKGWLFYGLTCGVVVLFAVLVTVFSEPGSTSIPLELNLMLVLGLGLLIGTSLAATSVNGDSTEGVLAPLQMTRLTAGDIAVGKLLASWAVSVIALVTLLPFLVYSYFKATWSIGEVLLMVATILFVVLVTTAIGLAWSSIAARSIASVALAHLTVGFLVLGSLVMFGVLTPLVSEGVTVTNRYPDWSQATVEQQNDPTFTGEGLPCAEETFESYITHTDQLAWLLLINPFVVVGETAPMIDIEAFKRGDVSQGVFQMMHATVADARMGPDPVQDMDYCEDPEGGGDQWQERQFQAAGYDRNPWVGLGLYTVTLLGAMWLTINRLRVPYRKLRGGTRVA
jgi:ABC-type transport system involved in multi-copper enzyme maturation permease subunit